MTENYPGWGVMNEGGCGGGSTVTGAHTGGEPLVPGGGGPGKPPSVSEGIIAGGGGPSYGKTFSVAGWSGGSGKMWLIWSEEHGRWWGPAACGYTYSIVKAGRYTKEEVDRIVASANIAVIPETGVIGDRRFNEIAIPDPL